MAYEPGPDEPTRISTLPGRLMAVLGVAFALGFIWGGAWIVAAVLGPLR